MGKALIRCIRELGRKGVGGLGAIGPESLKARTYLGQEEEQERTVPGTDRSNVTIQAHLQETRYNRRRNT